MIIVFVNCKLLAQLNGFREMQVLTTVFVITDKYVDICMCRRLLRVYIKL